MAEAHKINDGLYAVPLGDGKVQLRTLIQRMKTKKNGDAKIFQGKIHTNSCHSCEMKSYICAKEGPNKGSSFSTKLEREICNFYNGDNSKIIFYGGIEL